MQSPSSEHTSTSVDQPRPLRDIELNDSEFLRQMLGDAYDCLSMFHMKLFREGETRGLIGPRDVDIIWERHILNSMAVVPYIRAAVAQMRHKTVADIGSGGGFPGIVAAACLPECQFTLIEPMERRVAWLNECVDEMSLDNVRVLRARSEEVIIRIKHHEERPFAVATCRAVAPMTKLAGWTLPLIQSGGQLIALKGRSAQAEIEKASKQIIHARGKNPRVVEATVDSRLQSTHIVVIDKH